ncbi:hypothetical protein I4F81_011177 [Pyropia yezoensis]|uniref:Uncharacterized protein n=1 Tax=Pyropia yezoensis TaxID=2788 RepID=A0ACC3CEU7_PYRYE|nr:hypothetical protein I4F81_011177 [Neopyropia yezoensis]
MQSLPDLDAPVRARMDAAAGRGAGGAAPPSRGRGRGGPAARGRGTPHAGGPTVLPAAGGAAAAAGRGGGRGGGAVGGAAATAAASAGAGATGPLALAAPAGAAARPPTVASRSLVEAGSSPRTGAASSLAEAASLLEEPLKAEIFALRVRLEEANRLEAAAVDGVNRLRAELRDAEAGLAKSRTAKGALCDQLIEVMADYEQRKSERLDEINAIIGAVEDHNQSCCDDTGPPVGLVFLVV